MSSRNQLLSDVRWYPATFQKILRLQMNFFILETLISLSLVRLLQISLIGLQSISRIYKTCIHTFDLKMCIWLNGK